MAEQIGDGFSIVSSPDGFREDHGDVNHLYFGAMLHLILLRYGIGDYYCFKACIVNVRNGWNRKDSMSQHSINTTSGERSLSAAWQIEPQVSAMSSTRRATHRPPEPRSPHHQPSSILCESKPSPHSTSLRQKSLS